MTTTHLNANPRSFGRRRPFLSEAAAAPRPAIGDDLKLFAVTWFAGFVFVSIYLA
jgi:hypothetical protein